MPLNSIPPTTTVEGLRVKQEAALGELMVDVGFWGGAVPGNVPDLLPLWEAGVFGFKCFLSPSGVDEFPPLAPDEFLAALTEIARFDGLMIVHAEDARVLDEAPSPPSRAYRDFVLSRPDAAETTAIRQVLDGARETGARVHILHLSSARALDLIADAKAEGLRVTVETCPHYLCFAAETIPDAAPQFKCCPPIRDAGNREELWQALRGGLIDMVVSDHSPATAEEKQRGDGDLQQAWGGVSGLQVGFSAVAQEARRRGIGVEQVSRWMSRHPADLVGLTAKGRIEVGADADLAVYDTGVEFRIEADPARPPQPDLGVRRAPLRRPRRALGRARQRHRRRAPRPRLGPPAQEDRMTGPRRPDRPAAPAADGARPDQRRPAGAAGDVGPAGRPVRPGDDGVHDRDDGALPRRLPHRQRADLPRRRHLPRRHRGRPGLAGRARRPGAGADLRPVRPPAHRDRRALRRRGAHDRGAVGRGVRRRRRSRPRCVAVRPEGAGDRAGRHQHHDVPAAGRARRDLPPARRAALLRRDRLARRQRLRDRPVGHRRRDRRAAEVPGRPVRQRADHDLRRARST